MSGDFGTIFTIHIAPMIKTEGLSHCSSGMVMCPVSGIFRMEDTTFDLSEIIIIDPLGWKFEGGARPTLNSKSPTASLTQKFVLLLATTSK